MKTMLIIAGIAAALLVGGSLWSHSLANNSPDVVSRTGIHWHAQLSIIVGTTTVPIPAGIGLGPSEMPIHTHDDSGTIHLEFSGVVRKEQVTLGEFFRVWGKDIRSFGTNMRMTVNGKERGDPENYLLQDGDDIVLRYE